MGNWRPTPEVAPPPPPAAPTPPPVKSPPPPPPPADDPDLLAYLGLGAQTWVLALGRRGIGTRSELLALTRRDLATMPGIAGGVAVIEREIRRHGDQLAEPPTEKARRRPRYDETPTGETLEEWAERKDREEAEAAARTTLRIVQ